MDSVTQLALGAAVGESVLGNKIGRRAMLVGAVIASLPDLDVLIPFGGAVENFTYHRSFSHSYVVLTLISPFLALLLHRLFDQVSFIRCLIAVWLCLNTHVLLDSFTVYGTQVWWPLWNHPVALASIFIIDPLYTLPLLIGLAITFRNPSRTGWRRHATTAGLVISSLYLGWTLVAQSIVTQRTVDALAAGTESYHSVIVTPTPGSILWRIVARDDSSYLEGFHSLLDNSESMDFSRYDSGEQYDKLLDNHWPVQRLKWFTKGFYSMTEEEGSIVMTDLRMGIEASYVFKFKVAEIKAGSITTLSNSLLPFKPDIPRIKAVFRRIFDQSINLLPATDP